MCIDQNEGLYSDALEDLVPDCALSVSVCLELLLCLPLLLLRHMQTAVFAGTAAGMQEAQAISYQTEKSGCKTQLTSREIRVHSLVPKRFVLPSEHDLY